jgi:hypothetical protein
VLDRRGIYATGEQLVTRGIDIVDDDLQPLNRAGRSVDDAVADDDRTG